MFKGVINDAKSAAGSLIARYLARASVAVPFVVAFGFATAGGTLMLVERFGHRDAYLIVAGIFALLGMLAALFVRSKEHEEVVVAEQAVKNDTAEMATDAAATAAAQIPLALLGTLFTSPLGPSSLGGLVRMLGRNLPLAIMVAALALLFWPSKAEDDANTASADPPGVRPNGSYPADLQRDAA